MVTPVRGDVVVIPFPFSDLSTTKRRPAFVLTVLPGDDLILCQITSQARPSPSAVALTGADFTQGGLNRDSYVRPERLFTADTRIIAYIVGHVSDAKTQAVLAATRRLLA